MNLVCQILHVWKITKLKHDQGAKYYIFDIIELEDDPISRMHHSTKLGKVQNREYPIKYQF